MRFITVIALSGALILSASCKNAVVKKDAVWSIDKAAIISVTCNDRIDTSAVSGNFITILSELGNNDKLQLRTIIEDLKNRSYRESSMLFPFEIIPESRLFDQKPFQALRTPGTITAGRIAASGYPVITVRETAAVKNYLNNARSIDAAVIMDVTYHLVYSGWSNGIYDTIIARAVLTIAVIERGSGETILRNTVIGDSFSEIEQVLGKYDETAVHLLCSEATGSAYSAFSRWIQQIGQ